MDDRYNDGWNQMHDAPKDSGPVLLLVPTRFAKRSTHLQTQGEWFGSYWVIFNCDEAIQRVEPVAWRSLHAQKSKFLTLSTCLKSWMLDGC